MNFRFNRKRISGMLTVLPANERSFVEEMKNFNFPEARSLKLMEVMGYDKHRIVEPGVCVSDLTVFGLQHLFDRGLLNRDEIDALILVTQSPDHFAPPTSNIIQKRLGLKQDMLCLDINQACAGFVVGLIQAFMMLEQESIRKVVLVNADVLSRKTSLQDRNLYPVVGDGSSITIVERDPGNSTIYANLKMDGSRSGALTIPAGGFRLPSTPETALLEDAGDNNLRAKDHQHMDGSAVFNFVQTEVPPMIEELLAWVGATRESVDYYIFHQPNRFMLQKLADKLKVPYAKMPNNVVERFGNSGGPTIPTLVTLNFAGRLKENHYQVCFAGFGGGLTWASILMPLGGLKFCEIIDYP